MRLVRRHRSLLTLLAMAASLALPAGALAQSAGDEQYSDPFGEGWMIRVRVADSAQLEELLDAAVEAI